MSEDEQIAEIQAALRGIIADTAAPAAARAQAARTLAEMLGALGRHSAPPRRQRRAVTELSREELEAEAAAGAADDGAADLD